MQITRLVGRNLPFFAATLLGVLFVFNAGGCNSDAESFCNDYCDCTGCSDSEYDDCVDNYDDAVKEATDQGCEDQIGDLTSCYDDQFRCSDGKVDLDGCGHEEEVLANCLH